MSPLSLRKKAMLEFFVVVITLTFLGVFITI